MATTAQMSVEEYLNTSPHPDVNYIDGRIEERHMGENDHSAWQAAIQEWFLLHKKEWNVYVRPEFRVQVKPARFLVPDVTIVCVLEKIATTAPLAVFEVWSPANKVGELLANLRDYEEMGVEQIWFVDPSDGLWHRFVDGKLQRHDRFMANGISFNMQEIGDLVSGVIG